MCLREMHWTGRNLISFSLVETMLKLYFVALVWVTTIWLPRNMRLRKMHQTGGNWIYFSLVETMLRLYFVVPFWVTTIWLPRNTCLRKVYLGTLLRIWQSEQTRAISKLSELIRICQELWLLYCQDKYEIQTRPVISSFNPPQTKKQQNEELNSST